MNYKTLLLIVVVWANGAQANPESFRWWQGVAAGCLGRCIAYKNASDGQEATIMAGTLIIAAQIITHGGHRGSFYDYANGATIAYLLSLQFYPEQTRKTEQKLVAEKPASNTTSTLADAVQATRQGKPNSKGLVKE